MEDLTCPVPAVSVGKGETQMQEVAIWQRLRDIRDLLHKLLLLLLEQENNTQTKQVRESFGWLNVRLGVRPLLGLEDGKSIQRAARAPRGLAAAPCQEASEHHNVDMRGSFP